MRRASMWLNLYGGQAVRCKLKKGLKTQKNAFLAVNWAYVWQPDNHTGWTKPMPFASINFTHPKTNLSNLGKNIENWGSFSVFFESAIFNLFFSKIFFLFNISSKFLWECEVKCVLFVRLQGVDFSFPIGNFLMKSNSIHRFHYHVLKERLWNQGLVSFFVHKTFFSASLTLKAKNMLQVFLSYLCARSIFQTFWKNDLFSKFLF